ncbi:DUF4249 domain-containing protein [Fulvivirga sp. 29W222]|uniref:DUF4249 domain-containing protein n=1 Tax=Fulvivirga marina TaxID=2494733 RepID=A0A937KEN7_9BACT|nr:DUF4249 domain-containing protein [Fulvivirga marina]MBL6449779.1 DUF4249 domain-containing protein [Fulvivirga marina]
MQRGLLFCLFILFSNGCIEPYEFVIRNNSPALVVEGFISDVSYNETLEYPNDGRYFYVKLSYTSDVTNRRGEAVTGAVVKLENESNQGWLYTEEGDGKYLLLDKDFKAMKGGKYRILVDLPEGEHYESEWEAVPDGNLAPIGNISYEETEELSYQYVAQEEVIREIQGVDVRIGLPINETQSSVYYLWKFEPTWKFESPSNPSVNRRCWISSDVYLSDYVLHEDNVGGYDKKLFFMETVGNERLLWDFSLLVKQFAISKDYYQFMSDMQKQTNTSLSDALPYNLQTNLKAKDGTGVKGYFTVVSERATRWYFSQRDLSYVLKDKIREYCLNPLSDKGPLCWDCMAYGNGVPSTSPPVWWKK